MQLTNEEINGLANASPVFSELLKQAAANGGSANFDENVPATQGEVEGSSYPSNSNPVGVNPPAPGQPPEEEYAAVPQEGEAPPAADTPEAVGARAAQAFLGPIMDGAMQGDPNAQEIVAKAAGSVAGAVSAQYSKSMAGSPAVAGEGAPGAPMAPPTPPAIPTPEEDMATQIAGDQQPTPSSAPAGVPAEEEEELDENGQPVKKKKPPFPPK